MIDDRRDDRDRDDIDDLLAGLESTGDDCCCMGCGDPIPLDALEDAFPASTQYGRTVTTVVTCDNCGSDTAIRATAERSAGQCTIDLQLALAPTEPVDHDTDPLGIDADGQPADGVDPLDGVGDAQRDRTGDRD